jgi:hypothetical protein
MFCGECGASIGATDAACPSCGAKVQSHAASAMPKVSMAALKTPGFGVLGITRSILNSLSQGKVIRGSIAVVMQIGAVLALIAALVALVMILKASFQAPSAGITIGGIIVALFVVAALFAVAQIYLFRAQSVRELGDSPFTVIPILSILFRAAGETYAVIALCWGIGGCLFTWMSGVSPMGLLSGIGNLGPLAPTMSGFGEGSGNVFLDGLIFLAGLAVAAFVALVVFYAMAELVVVIVDIAINVRKIENRSPSAA